MPGRPSLRTVALAELTGLSGFPLPEARNRWCDAGTAEALTEKHQVGSTWAADE